MGNAKKRANKPLTREQFEALDDAEQRRVLARDVLAAIDAGTMLGSLCRQLFSDNPGFDGYSGKAESPDEAVCGVATCYVCALGAPLVAAARRVDALGGYFFSSDALSFDVGSGREYLYQFFPHAVLLRMEAAYEEDSDYVYGYDGPAEEYSDAEVEANNLFRESFAYGTPRLRAIWQRVADDPEGLFHLTAP